MSQTTWTIIPYVNGAELAIEAAKDAMAQDVPDARALIISNGGSAEDRKLVERFASNHPMKCLAWFHTPALPSLSATWNRALDFVWETGGTEALVTNHDVRLTKDTYRWLKKILIDEEALLVTATGVEEEETLFAEVNEKGQEHLAFDEAGKVRKGGPGFSCFMISKRGHEKYRFDEMLIPAFCEDLDMHRRMILGGDGNRIFGTNVRYLHLGGQTLKRMTPEQREATEKAITNGARARYARKWGGAANEETFIEPFFKTDPPNGEKWNVPEWIIERWKLGESVKNPDLFNVVREGW